MPSPTPSTEGPGMRDIITTWLELAGLLLLAGSAGVEVARWTFAGGLATSGVLLIGSSLLISVRAPKRRPAGESTA